MGINSITYEKTGFFPSLCSLPEIFQKIDFNN